ncbi:hypothetical protein PybrP1_009278 [[Pythium] brassicae (nom. inval.)]|nr:hypothetical protein PybrP1_009278 [[Pythium] brassicae (nom. inval.)]
MASDEELTQDASVTSEQPHESPKRPEERSDAPEGDDGNATESEAEETAPLPRVTRTRSSLLRVVESDSESEKSAVRRTRRQHAMPINGASKPAAAKASGRKKKGKGRGRPKRGATKSDSDSDDSVPGEYVNVQVGDCVLLDSGDPNDSFVALVSSVQRSQNFDREPGTFTAQWYYKPDDVRADVRGLIKGGVLEGEVFLSPHKDKNSIDAVLGLCNVVSPEEYEEVQTEIKRGFREKTKPYFICRYKYYPNRPTKKALEIVRHDAIRSHLGPLRPKVGEHFQARVPEFTGPPTPSSTATTAVGVPWRSPALPQSPLRCQQVWSPLVLEHQSSGLHQFLQLLKPVQYSVGNVLKLFRRRDALTEASGHVRCIVVSYEPADHVRVCLSTGHVQAVLPSELSSPLGDDAALTHFYQSRFNLCAAIAGCAADIERAQRLERDAFRREVVEFSQLEVAKRQAQALTIEALELYTEEDEEEDDEGDGDDDDDDAQILTTRKRRK